jgi:uncharacterized membrane protein
VNPPGSRPAPGEPAAPLEETAAPAEPAPAPHEPREDLPGWTRSRRIALAAIVLVVLAAYTTYSWARHAQYKTTGFDLGIFDQAVRAYANFEAPISPLKAPGWNLLGDHFHPIIAVLAPLYWIWDDPRVLLTAQAVLFAVSILPVAAFTARRLGARAALVVAGVYGLSWPLERAVHFDFHEIAFAVPLIALLIDSLDRRTDRRTVLLCLALLLVREDMGALLVVVGVLVALRRPREGGRRRPSVVHAAGLAVLGVIGYWFATSVVIPGLAPQGSFTYWTFPALGPDPASALRVVVTQPWRVAYLMVVPAVKAATLGAIFLPTAFLALLSPYCLLTLPFLAERMLNSRALLWQTNFHYTSVIAPVLVMAAVDSVDRLRRRYPRLRVERPVRLPGGRRVAVSFLAVWLAWCVGVVAVGLAFKKPDYPVSGLWSGRVWVKNERLAAVKEALPMIPPDTCVEADNQLAPHLTRTNYVTRVGRSEGLATWLVLDLNQPDTGWESPKPADALRQAQAKGFEVVYRRGPIVLLHLDAPVQAICRRVS